MIYKHALALWEWHLGEIASCKATIAEAISLAKKLNDMNALALAQFHAGFAGHFDRDPAEAERCASNMIELSTRHNFAFWRAGGEVFRGWAQSISGSTAVGIAPDRGRNSRLAGHWRNHRPAISHRNES